MARRRAAKKRQVLPDAKFGDIVISKFINCVMEQGKKSLAEGIVYGALTKIQGKVSKNALEVFREAVDNVKPNVEVKSRRVGGATYPVPTEVRTDRAQALSIRWLIGSASKRSEHTMMERLAGELMDASNSRGAAVKKRDDTHKMAEANRAFSHYRW